MADEGWAQTGPPNPRANKILGELVAALGTDTVIIVGCDIEEDERPQIGRLVPTIINASFPSGVVVGKPEIAAMLRLVAKTFEAAEKVT